MGETFVITEALRERLEDLNRIAFELKFNENLTGVETEKYQIRLYKDMMEVVQDWFIKRARLSLTDTRNYIPDRDVHNLEEFNLIYLQAYNDYGKEHKYDLETGEPIPFTKLFFSYWRTQKKFKNVNENGGFLEQNSEEYSYRDGMAKRHLQYFAKVNRVQDYVLPKKVSGYKKFLEELKKVQVDVKTAMQLADELFLNQHITGDEIMVDNGCLDWEHNDAMVESESTRLRENEALEKETAADAGQRDVIQKFLQLYKSVMEDKAVSTINRNYIRAFITMNIVNSGLDTDLDLKGLVDINLAEKMRSRKSGCPDYVVLAEYMGKKPDTVRKKLNSVQKFLFEKSRHI